jgi:hypothetical protein
MKRLLIMFLVLVFVGGCVSGCAYWGPNPPLSFEEKQKQRQGEQLFIGQTREAVQFILSERNGHWWRESKDSSGYEIWCYGHYDPWIGHYKTDFTLCFDHGFLAHWTEW